MERKALESEASHENSKPTQADHEIPVIYYLSRNGQLEHPHLMYVSISSSHGTPRLKGNKSYNKEKLTLIYRLAHSFTLFSFQIKFYSIFLIRCDK